MPTQPHGDLEQLLRLATNEQCLRVHSRLLNARDGKYLDAVNCLVRAERITDGVLRSGLTRDRSDFEALLKAVYRIRSNLFHGLKSPSDMMDRRAVEAATTIVWSLLAELIERPARRLAG